MYFDSAGVTESSNRRNLRTTNEDGLTDYSAGSASTGVVVIFSDNEHLPRKYETASSHRSSFGGRGRGRVAG